jgi:hypothetical protein
MPLMFPKPHKLTDKEKYEKKLLKFKEMKQRQIDRLREGKKKQVTKVKEPNIAELKRTLQKLVNKIARERDKRAGLPCISCQVRPIEEGGHFWAMGSNSALRFNLENINGQCQSCNKWQHGNLLNYRLNLVKKIGEERVKFLDEHHNDIKKWTREELKDMIAAYKQLAIGAGII